MQPPPTTFASTSSCPWLFSSGDRCLPSSQEMVPHPFSLPRSTPALGPSPRELGTRVLPSLCVSQTFLEGDSLSPLACVTPHKCAELICRVPPWGAGCGHSGKTPKSSHGGPHVRACFPAVASAPSVSGVWILTQPGGTKPYPRTGLHFLYGQCSIHFFFLFFFKRTRPQSKQVGSTSWVCVSDLPLVRRYALRGSWFSAEGLRKR